MKYKILIDDQTWLSREWHPTKNLPLTPQTVPAYSHKKVWWICLEFKHEWLAACKDRTLKKSGCPICSGRKAHISNCLRTTHPALSSEWHPTKNEPLSPYDITAGSKQRVWWRCPKDQTHEWQTACVNRANKQSGCPFCSGRVASISNSLAHVHTILTEEWHTVKNDNLTPSNVTAGSRLKVWWICNNNPAHEWLASINNRTNGTGCPICASINRTVKRRSHHE